MAARTYLLCPEHKPHTWECLLIWLLPILAIGNLVDGNLDKLVTNTLVTGYIGSCFF